MGNNQRSTATSLIFGLMRIGPDFIADPDPTLQRLRAESPVQRNPFGSAFLSGVHVCLGATLARIEGRIAIAKFVARLPTLQATGPSRVVPLAPLFRGLRLAACAGALMQGGIHRAA